MPYQTMIETPNIAEITRMIGWCDARWPGGLGLTWDYAIALDSEIGWAGASDVASGLVAGFTSIEDHAEFCLTWR